MLQRLHRKLYLYAFLILFTAIGLTVGTILLLFQFDQRKIFNAFLRQEAFLIQQEIKEAQQLTPPQLATRTRQLGEQLNWSIAYWQAGRLVIAIGAPLPPLDARQFVRLQAQREMQFLPSLPFLPRVALLLDDQAPPKGYLILQFNGFRLPYLHIRPPLLAGGLILFFLALLLIPYSRYLLQPFAQLVASIRQVSAGDLHTPLVLPEKSDFKDLADIFNAMRLKIRTMIDQKQRLLADVSHELRSPLTRIQLSLELLAQDPATGPEYLPQVFSDLEALNALIQDILDASRLELQPELELECQQVDLTAFIFENVERYQLLFEECQLTLQPDFPHENVFVSLDPKLMGRVFNNLFSNLVKYAPAGSSVDLSLRATADKALVALRDRGSGVAPDEYERIFEPFYRSDRSRSRKTGGTGLGLAIARQGVETHGGKLWAGPPPDDEGGMVFYLQLDRV